MEKTPGFKEAIQKTMIGIPLQGFTEDTDLYDFMIEMDDSKGLKYYLRNIDHYLLKINTKHE